MLAVLSIHSLVKSGMLPNSRWRNGRRRSLEIGDWYVALDDVTLIATPRLEQDETWFKICEVGSTPFRVGLGGYDTGKGWRWFFICDCCSKRRTYLVLSAGSFICCDHFASRRSELRGVQREYLLAHLKKQEPIIVRATDLGVARYKIAATIEEREAKERLAAKRQSKLHAVNSTSFACENGRGMGQSDIYHEYCQRPASEWRAVGAPGEIVRPSHGGIIDDFPELDIRKLVSKNQGHGGVIAQAFRWGGPGNAGPEVLIFCDWRDGDPIVMACFDFADPAGRRWQRVKVCSQDYGRYRWVCPVTEANVDKLYLRGDWFASAKALRLVSASQRASGRDARHDSRAC